MTNLYNRNDIMIIFANAIIDATIYHLITLQKDFINLPNNGRTLSKDGFQLY